jgi:hypothetical protein
MATAAGPHGEDRELRPPRIEERGGVVLREQEDHGRQPPGWSRVRRGNEAAFARDEVETIISNAPDAGRDSA